MTSTVTGIFATPVSVCNIGREFTDSEGNFFTVHLDNMMKNLSNFTSINRNILDSIELAELRSLLEEKLNLFYREIYSPAGDSKSVITQSWLNLTRCGESHHRHSHSNSIISGVLYLKSNKNLDKIIFHKSAYEQISIEPTHITAHNCKEVGFSVGTGDLVLFPSSLVHSVLPTESDFRISLAFNSFIKGQIGDSVLSNKLIIN